MVTVTAVAAATSATVKKTLTVSFVTAGSRSAAATFTFASVVTVAAAVIFRPHSHQTCQFLPFLSHDKEQSCRLVTPVLKPSVHTESDDCSSP